MAVTAPKLLALFQQAKVFKIKNSGRTLPTERTFQFFGTVNPPFEGVRG